MSFLVSNRVGRHTHTDLYLLEGLLIAQDDARHDLGRRAMETIAHGLQSREMLAYQLDKVFVVQISGGGDNDVSRGEALSVKIDYRAAFKLSHRVSGPKNWSAEGMILP